MSATATQPCRIHPIGAPQIHEMMKTLVMNIFPIDVRKSRPRVLDAAAGNGFLSTWLYDQGFEVTAVDLDPAKWALDKIDCMSADLNADLPFESGTFDIVVTVETIEHLENPYHFLREICRVLKPAGHMIIATPNVHSFKSRIKYAILSMPSLFEYVHDDHMGQHISPVSIGTLLYSFDRTGMELLDLWSVGPPMSPTLRFGKLAFNQLTLRLLKYVKSKGPHSDDYYIKRLTEKQLDRLIDEMILIVLARKGYSS